MKKILLLLATILILVGCSNNEIKNEKQIVKNNEMLSYTVDGEKIDKKPTKEEGYIVNKIVCDNGTDMMWDNDNWEVELTKVESNDRCMVDFTKDINKEGYRVTVRSNNASSLDSLSKATTKNGTIKIYSSSIIESVTGCNAGIDGNKVIISNVNSNQTCKITIEDKTLAGTIKNAYNADINRKRTNFAVIDNGTHADTPAGLTGGLYAGIDDQGTTYYFSGDGTNMHNWVSFAGKKWRIIRINGNGSVRLLYAGSGVDDGYVGSTLHYATSDGQYDHPAYVGWRYTLGGSLSADRGNTNKSNAYATVEAWYNGLSSTYKSYIDTKAIYCNDRNIGSGSYSMNATFYYAAYSRLASKGTPVFACSNANDIFSTFGLMSADEVVYAGGLYETKNPNAYYYLNASGGSSTGDKFWWTMSPYRFGSNGIAWVFYVRGSSNPGYLNPYYVSDSAVVRPVISLKAEVLVTGGNGSASTPYELTL